MTATGTVSVTALNTSNYPTWKVQCKMALIKDDLWDIVEGVEKSPDQEREPEKYSKFKVRKNKALALIVLSVDPSQIYLLGDPQDPTVVWRKLEEQFQRKSWINKRELRKKLYSMRLTEGQSIGEYIKNMTELFDSLAVIGDSISEEDRVVHLLASLPDSYNTLVTALEASSETVPSWGNVVERLRHEEKKMTNKSEEEEGRRALIGKRSTKKKQFTCHHCGKPGHFKRDCRLFIQKQSGGRSGGQKPSPGQSVHLAEGKKADSK